MTALSKAIREARERTLATVRAEVDREGCVKLRPEVFCRRDLVGWRLIPKTEVR